MKKLITLLVKLLIFVLITGISYSYLSITRYAPGEEPDSGSFFPLVLEVPESNPPRFELFEWSELKKLLATDPKRIPLLPAGERHFTLTPKKDVRFQVMEVSGGQHVKVTYSTGGGDLIFWSEYRVVGNTIVPVRVRAFYGRLILFSIVLGIIGTTLLSCLYTRVRRRVSL